MTILGFEHPTGSQAEKAMLDCSGNGQHSSPPRTGDRVEMYRSRDSELQVVCWLTVIYRCGHFFVSLGDIL